MTISEAIIQRHSVRSYLDKPIPQDLIDELNNEISVCNKEGGLNIQMVENDPNEKSIMAHYGKFSNVQQYIVLIGKKCDSLEEKVGYYGERIVLKAQMLGLNTCWVALTYSKSNIKKKCSVNKDEKVVCVISVGYGKTQGVPHKSKPENELFKCEGDMPDWFKSGVGAAILAPTAMNQQKFVIVKDGDNVEFNNLGGFYSKMDLGIIKYHFEIGSGRKVFN